MRVTRAAAVLRDIGAKVHLRAHRGEPFSREEVPAALVLMPAVLLRLPRKDVAVWVGVVWRWATVIERDGFHHWVCITGGRPARLIRPHARQRTRAL